MSRRNSSAVTWPPWASWSWPPSPSWAVLSNEPSLCLISRPWPCFDVTLIQVDPGERRPPTVQAKVAAAPARLSSAPASSMRCRKLLAVSPAPAWAVTVGPSARR